MINLEVVYNNIKNKHYAKGDIVNIKDGSYMTTITDGEISHYGKHVQYIGKDTSDYVIIHIGGSYPSCEGLGGLMHMDNNTIIQNKENGEVWFCDFSLNIRKIKPRYTINDLKKIIGHDFEIIQ